MKRTLLRNALVSLPFFALTAWLWIMPKPIDVFARLTAAVVAICASLALYQPMKGTLLRNALVSSPIFALTTAAFLAPKPIDLSVGLACAVVALSASAALCSLDRHSRSERYFVSMIVGAQAHYSFEPAP